MGSKTPWGAGRVIRADKHPVIPQVGGHTSTGSILKKWRWLALHPREHRVAACTAAVLPGTEDQLCPGEMFV